jgi:hypothetical protein
MALATASLNDWSTAAKMDTIQSKNQRIRVPFVRWEDRGKGSRKVHTLQLFDPGSLDVTEVSSDILHKVLTRGVIHDLSH